MRRIIACIVVNLLVITKTSSINYCGAKMCGNTNAHTFCQFNEGPSSKCTGYIKSPLSDEEKARVMARLNRRRSDAASGRLRGLHPAGNMLKLRWVEELAREAQRWADQCRPPGTPEEHDVCRDLSNLYLSVMVKENIARNAGESTIQIVTSSNHLWKKLRSGLRSISPHFVTAEPMPNLGTYYNDSITVGQCVASVLGEAPGLRVESMVDMWYMQSMLYKGNATFYIPPATSRGYYGDFGQIIWSKTYMVGCGRSRFMSPWRGRLRSVERLVCNFAPRGPSPARPLWAPSPPASVCSARSHPDPSLTALCTYQSKLNELYDIDNSMTLEEHIVLNTVLQIEENNSLNYHGSLDELYLTRIAIVTIENSVTIPYYNSLQKRDIPDLIALQDAKLDVYQVYTNKDILQNKRATVYPYQEIPVGRYAKNKFQLIGRPKTYNMEDLNNIHLHQDEENDQTRVDITKNEKDLYSEYGLLEVIDDNPTTSESNTTDNTANEVSANQDDKTELMHVTYDETSSILNNITMMESTSGTATYLNAFEYPIQVVNRSQDKENAEDYNNINDPETVRELQEALDRMEQTLAPKLSGAQGKVRRDLRDLPPDIKIDNNQLLNDVAKNSASSEEIERNKTLERGPMLNMVLKYMPYLKHYESGILGKAISGSDCVCPSFILVLTFCL